MSAESLRSAIGCSEPPSGFASRSPAWRTLVEPVLAHLEARGAEAHDLELEVARVAGDLALLEDGAVVARCTEPAEMAPLLKAHLRVRVVDRHDYFMQIHAGAVLVGDACMLLPGPPGSGKSTLTAGLVAAGLGYLSDELALLEGIPLAIRAVPLALTVKPGAVDVLEPLYPGLAGLPVHRREDGKQVRYLPPPASALPADAAAHPLNWIVFPRYTPGVGTQLRALSKPEALERLLACCLSLPEWLTPDSVERLVALLRAAETHELVLASLPEGVRALQTLIERPA